MAEHRASTDLAKAKARATKVRNAKNVIADRANKKGRPLKKSDDPATVRVAPAASNARSSSPEGTRRLSADLPAHDAATLADLAQETGFNKVTTLVRAIRVLAELVRAERDGGELTITYADGRRERLLLR